MPHFLDFFVALSCIPQTRANNGGWRAFRGVYFCVPAAKSHTEPRPYLPSSHPRGFQHLRQRRREDRIPRSPTVADNRSDFGICDHFSPPSQVSHPRGPLLRALEPLLVSGDGPSRRQLLPGLSARPPSLDASSKNLEKARTVVCPYLQKTRGVLSQCWGSVGVPRKGPNCCDMFGGGKLPCKGYAPVCKHCSYKISV